jgi:hypothetical protein
MAKLTVSGLDEVIKQIDHISTLDNGRLAKTMLKEGSVPIAEEWQKVAETNHSRHYNLQGKLVQSTGQMKRSVATKKVKKNKYGYFTVTYPQGIEEYEYINRNGVKVPRIRHGQVVKFRNAEKAFFNHFGFFNKLTGKFVQGDRWVDKVEMTAGPKAEKEMQRVWDEYLKTQNKK